MEGFCAAKPQNCDLKTVRFSDLLREDYITIDLQETGRKSTTTKTQAFQSKPTQNTRLKLYTKPCLNESNARKKTKTNEPKDTATAKTACEDLPLLRQNISKKNNNEVT